MALTATEQLIYNTFKAQTQSVDSEASMIAIAKMLASLTGTGEIKIAGQISGETMFPTMSVADLSFSAVLDPTFELLNITVTSTPEKFVVPADGLYRVSYFINFNANQNVIARVYPKLNSTFLNDEKHTVYIETYSGHNNGFLTFGKSILMELVEGDNIGLGSNGQGTFLSVNFNIQKI